MQTNKIIAYSFKKQYLFTYLAVPGFGCGTEDLVPWRGSNLGPQHWERRAWATGGHRASPGLIHWANLLSRHSGYLQILDCLMAGFSHFQKPWPPKRNIFTRTASMHMYNPGAHTYIHSTYIFIRTSVNSTYPSRVLCALFHEESASCDLLLALTTSR